MKRANGSGIRCNLLGCDIQTAEQAKQEGIAKNCLRSNGTVALNLSLEVAEFDSHSDEVITG